MSWCPENVPIETFLAYRLHQSPIPNVLSGWETGEFGLSMRGHQTFKDDGTWDFNCYWKKSGQILTQSCTCCDIGDFYAQMIPRTNKCLTWKKIGHAFCTSQLSSLLFFVISSVYLIWLSWCLSRGERRNGWKIHI